MDNGVGWPQRNKAILQEIFHWVLLVGLNIKVAAQKNLLNCDFFYPGEEFLICCALRRCIFILSGLRFTVFNLIFRDASLEHQLNPGMLGGIPVALDSQIVPIRTKIIVDVELADLCSVLVEYILAKLTSRVRNFFIFKCTIRGSICLVVEDPHY